MRSENAARAVVAILLILTCYLMYLIFRPFLPGIAWAVVLVVAFHGAYARLARILGGREWLAATLLSLLLACVIVIPTAVAAVKVAQGVGEAYDWLAEWSASGGSILARVEAHPWLGPITSWIKERLDLAKLDVQAMAISAVRTVGASLAARTGSFVKNGLQIIMTLVVVLLTTTVLFHEGGRLAATLRRYLPLSQKDREEVLVQLREVVRAVFFGVLLTALVQATLGTIGFLTVGVPNAVLLGAAMFLCALLPGGTALVWAPVAIWLFATGHTLKGVFLLVWGVLAVSSVDNLLRPLFIRRGVRMPMILVFFGTLGGMLAFGLIGLFTGPLVITIFLFLLEVVRRDFFRNEDAAAGRADP